MDTLPPELLCLVFFPVPCNVDEQLLFRVRLVCRAVYAAVDHIFVNLFETLCFDLSEPSLRYLLSCVQVSPRLAAHICSVSITYYTPTLSNRAGKWMLQHSNIGGVSFRLETFSREDEVWQQIGNTLLDSSTRQNFESSGGAALALRTILTALPSLISITVDDGGFLIQKLRDQKWLTAAGSVARVSSIVLGVLQSTSLRLVSFSMRYSHPSQSLQWGIDIKDLEQMGLMPIVVDRLELLDVRVQSAVPRDLLDTVYPHIRHVFQHMSQLTFLAVDFIRGAASQWFMNHLFKASLPQLQHLALSSAVSNSIVFEPFFRIHTRLCSITFRQPSFCSTVNFSQLLMGMTCSTSLRSISIHNVCIQSKPLVYANEVEDLVDYISVSPQVFTFTDSDDDGGDIGEEWEDGDGSDETETSDGLERTVQRLVLGGDGVAAGLRRVILSLP